MNAENIGWSSTVMHCKLVEDGDRVAIQIDVSQRDKRRLEVLMSKAMTAVAVVEDKVAEMTDCEVENYLDCRTWDRVVVTENNPAK